MHYTSARIFIYFQKTLLSPIDNCYSEKERKRSPQKFLCKDNPPNWELYHIPLRPDSFKLSISLSSIISLSLLAPIFFN